METPKKNGNSEITFHDISSIYNPHQSAQYLMVPGKTRLCFRDGKTANRVEELEKLVFDLRNQVEALEQVIKELCKEGS